MMDIYPLQKDVLKRYDRALNDMKEVKTYLLPVKTGERSRGLGLRAQSKVATVIMGRYS